MSNDKFKIGDFVAIIDNNIYSSSIKMGDIAEITDIIKGEVILYFHQHKVKQETMLAYKDFRKLNKLEKAMK